MITCGNLKNRKYFKNHLLLFLISLLLFQICFADTIFQIKDNSCNNETKLVSISFNNAVVYNSETGTSKHYIKTGSTVTENVVITPKNDFSKIAIEFYRDSNLDGVWDTDPLKRKITDDIEKNKLYSISFGSGSFGEIGPQRYQFKLYRDDYYVDEGMVWNDYYHRLYCLDKVTFETGTIYVVSTTKPEIGLEFDKESLETNSNTQVDILGNVLNLESNTYPDYPEKPALNINVRCRVKETGYSCGSETIDEINEGTKERFHLTYTPTQIGTYNLEVEVSGEYLNEEALNPKKETLVLVVEPVCGDQVCEGSETTVTCAQDCAKCGDNICDLKLECTSKCSDCSPNDCLNNDQCDTLFGENCIGASNDCPCPTSWECNPNNVNADTFGCYSPGCGDSVCDIGTECVTTCEDCSNAECLNNDDCDIARGENCKVAKNDCACPSDYKCDPDHKNSDNFGCFKLECGDDLCDSLSECLEGCKDCKKEDCVNNEQCDTIFGENCENTPNDCSCIGDYSICFPSAPEHNEFGCAKPFCGDRECTRKECDLGCKEDCSESDCRNNNQCDLNMGETCTHENDCPCEKDQICQPNNEKANILGCVNVICGDDICHQDENCCKDCGCDTGFTCVWEKNTCIELGNPGDKCDIDGNCKSGLCCAKQCREKDRGICCNDEWFSGEGRCCFDTDCVNPLFCNIEHNCVKRNVCGNKLCERTDTYRECKMDNENGYCKDDCKITDCKDGLCTPQLGENCDETPNECNCPVTIEFIPPDQEEGKFIYYSDERKPIKVQITNNGDSSGTFNIELVGKKPNGHNIELKQVSKRKSLKTKESADIVFELQEISYPKENILFPTFVTSDFTVIVKDISRTKEISNKKNNHIEIATKSTIEKITKTSAFAGAEGAYKFIALVVGIIGFVGGLILKYKKKRKSNLITKPQDKENITEKKDEESITTKTEKKEPPPDKSSFEEKTEDKHKETKYEENKKCPKCQKNVKDKWSICPYCKTNLKEQLCPSCGEPIESDWAACPTCGEDLELQKDSGNERDNGNKSGKD